MKRVQKEYTYAFLVEPTKLTRLIDLIHERLGEHNETIVRDHFEAFLPDKRVEEVSSLEDVLSLENSRKKRIERLLIVSSAGSSPEHQVEVDFGVVKTPINSAPSAQATKLIAVNVVSNDSKWNARTLSEIEEQLERTRLRQFSPILALAGLMIFMLVVLLLQVGPIKQREDLSGVMWLDGPSLERVEKILSQGRTITDEEMREINTIQLRNLVLDQRPPQPSGRRARKLILMGLPTVFLLGCALVLAFTCYPTAVFLWGDETERYANLLQRRKVLWGIIISLMVVGVFSKFLYEGIAPWLPLE